MVDCSLYNKIVRINPWQWCTKVFMRTMGNGKPIYRLVQSVTLPVSYVTSITAIIIVLCIITAQWLSFDTIVIYHVYGFSCLICPLFFLSPTFHTLSWWRQDVYLVESLAFTGVVVSSRFSTLHVATYSTCCFPYLHCCMFPMHHFTDPHRVVSRRMVGINIILLLHCHNRDLFRKI